MLMRTLHFMFKLNIYTKCTLVINFYLYLQTLVAEETLFGEQYLEKCGCCHWKYFLSLTEKNRLVEKISKQLE